MKTSRLSRRSVCQFLSRHDSFSSSSVANLQPEGTSRIFPALKVDYFGQIRSFFHPFVVRMYNSTDMNFVHNEDVKKIRFFASQNLDRLAIKRYHSSKPVPVVDETVLADLLAKALLSTSLSNEESKAICSSFAVLRPNNERIWRDLGQACESRRFDQSCTLLVAYTLGKLSRTQGYSDAAIRHIARNIEEYVIFCSSSARYWEASAGSGGVVDSQSIELFGVLIRSLQQLVPLTATSTEQAAGTGTGAGTAGRVNREPTMRRSQLGHLLTEFTKVLEAQPHPVRLSTLVRSVKPVCKLDIKADYLFCSAALAQVERSLNAAASDVNYQISNQLLQFMNDTSHKNFAVIAAIERYLSSPKATSTALSSADSTRLFELCVGMGSVNMAVAVLTRLVEEANSSQLTFLNRNSSSKMSDEVKTKLRALLTNGPGRRYTLPDLFLAMFLFIADETDHQSFLLLLGVEAVIAPQIVRGDFSAMDCRRVLYTYALGSRNHPEIIKSANDVIAKNWSTLIGQADLSDIVWSNAKLWHRTSMNRILADHIIHNHSGTGCPVTSSSDLNSSMSSVKLLWGLAVLGELTIEDFSPFASEFQRLVNRMPENKRKIALLRQLVQIETELFIKQKQKVQTGEASEAYTPLFRPNPSDLYQPSVTSAMHLDISSTLSEYGISHVNEKELDNSIVVDIFIPPIDETYRGTVLEVDGPSHFESYLEMPVGATVMKRRHLSALGYEICSVTHHKYNRHWSFEKKSNIIKKSLGARWPALTANSKMSHFSHR